MLSVLMVAEKPSIADTISQILSSGRKTIRKGISPVCKVHEYQGEFLGEVASFKVTSTTGHIFTSDFPHRYNNWETTDPLDLFEATTVKLESNPKLYITKHLANEAKNCDHIVLWLDCDREGENICFEVLEVTQDRMRACPGRQNVWRAQFSSLADVDIRKSMKSLGTPNENEALSVDARQELDLKVGVAFTRFQSRYFQAKYGDLGSTLVSYGPCQTPTLQFCVQRHDEIVSFSPENFWTLDVGVICGLRELSLEWSRERVFDRRVAVVFEIMVDQAKVASVTDITSKPQSQTRPNALNTVAMLKSASSQLGIGPMQALQIAERLYLSGFVTYPRTETSRYPNNFDLKAAVGQQKSNQQWGSYSSKLLTVGLNVPREGTDAGDHPPITPVRSANPGDMGFDEWRLYELITRHFLATVSADCSFLRTTAKIDIGGESFTISGRKVLEPGFTAITREAMNDVSLPELFSGQELPVKHVNLRAGLTSAPGFLTESELLGLMEHFGIGTDASMPTHIQNICDRNYVKLVGNRQLQPTKLGITLVHGYFLIDPELVLPKVRSVIEKECSLIAKGQADWKEVVVHALHQFKAKFQFFVSQIERMDTLFESNFTTVSDMGSPFSKCGTCSRYMHFISKKPFRLFCKTCNKTYNLPQDGAIKLYQELKCPIDQFEVLLCVQKLGRTFPLCPMCYNNPPFEDMGKAMNCLQCLHPTCRHSVSSVGVCKCSQENCRGMICLDVVSRPLWKLICSGCSFQLKFLGRYKSISVSKNSCEECDMRILDIVRHKDESFVDGTLERSGCLNCAEELKSLVEAGFAPRFRRKLAFKKKGLNRP